MRVITVALCAWAAMAGAVAAKTYLCKVAINPSQLGYITDVYAIDIDEKAKTVVVDDRVIEYFNKGPIEAFSPNITPAKITFNWDLFAVNDDGQRAKLSYRGVLFLRDTRFRVTMRPIGYANDFEGEGKCKAN